VSEFVEAVTGLNHTASAQVLTVLPLVAVMIAKALPLKVNVPSLFHVLPLRLWFTYTRFVPFAEMISTAAPVVRVGDDVQYISTSYVPAG